MILSGDDGYPASKVTQGRSLKRILCDGSYKGPAAKVTVIVVIEEAGGNGPIADIEPADKGLRTRTRYCLVSVQPRKVKNIGTGNSRNLERARVLFDEISAARRGLCGGRRFVNHQAIPNGSNHI